MSKRCCTLYRLITGILVVNVLWIAMAYFFLTSFPESHPLRRANTFLPLEYNSSLIYVIEGSNGVSLFSNCGSSSEVVDYLPEGSVVVAAYRNSSLPRSGVLTNIQVYFPTYGWLCQMKCSKTVDSFDSGRIIFVSPVESDNGALGRSSGKQQVLASAGLSTAGPRATPEGMDSRVRSSWMEQWPIGNGRVGALVGGSLYAEVVPLSVSGFYTVTRPLHEKGQVDHRNGGQGVERNGQRRFRRPSAMDIAEGSKSDRDQHGPSSSQSTGLFERSRKQLLHGDVESSSAVLSEALQSDPLGRFEYVCDLLLTYFPTAPHSRRASALSTSTSAGRPLRPPLVRGQAQTLRGRTDLLSEFLHVLMPLHSSAPRLSASASAGSGGQGDSGADRRSRLEQQRLAEQHERQRLREGLMDFGTVHHQRSFLDTVSGTASSVFVVDGHTAREDSQQHGKTPAAPLHLHSREWFASEESDVLVGSVRCVSLESEESVAGSLEETKDISGCLNVHMRLGREMRNSQGPPGATSSLGEEHWAVRAWKHRRRGPLAFPSQFSYGDTTARARWFDLSAPLLSAGGGSDSGTVGGVMVGGFEQPFRSEHVVAISFSLQPDFNTSKGSNGHGNAGADSAPLGPGGVDNHPSQPLFQRSGEGGRGAAEGILHPGVEVCGALLCLHSALAWSGDSGGGEEGGSQSALKYVTCSGASEMIMITAVVSGSDIVYAAGESASAEGLSSGEAMRAQCWEKVEAAVRVGPAELRRRHRMAFAARMARDSAVVHFAGGESTHASVSPTCTESSNLQAQLSCLRSELSAEGSGKTLPTSASTIRLVNSAMWFSKYLLLSSSSRSVANLQGLWADGPDSAWNGDHHLNINQQMIYWSALSLGLGPTVMPPLVRFIQDLAHEGGHTARNLYNCRGWVSHGFTDNLLHGGMRAGLMWSLCVTCGAWMALHLFDYMAYSNDLKHGDHAASVANNTTVVFLHGTFLPVYRSLVFFFLDYMFEGPDGTTHTGPTTSPENSYRIAKTLPNGQKVFVYQQVALSPAFDMSVLRQVVNAFRLAVDWAEKLSGSYPALVGDRDLCEKFTRIVQKMKHAANPLVSERSHRIVEYPVGVWNNGSLRADLDADGETCKSPGNEYVCLSEDFDLGHRHFSSMHWVYPGIFLPTAFQGGRDRLGEEGGRAVAAGRVLQLDPHLLTAAKKTLSDRSAHMSGHTGWSAAWEACLWARLRSPNEFWTSLTRVLADYTAPNLMALHPALRPADKLRGCDTCFEESSAARVPNKEGKGGWTRVPADKRVQARQFDETTLAHKRGMITEFGGVFQLDANMGLAAAVVEALVHSHYAGALHLLPALPEPLQRSGTARNVVVKGGLRVSLEWTGGSVDVCILRIDTWHPWLEGMEPVVGGPPGYFRTPSRNHPGDTGMSRWISYSITAPNILKPLGQEAQGSASRQRRPHPSRQASYSSSSAALPAQCAWRTYPPFGEKDSSDHTVSLMLETSSFPCALVLCGGAQITPTGSSMSKLEETTCRQRAKMLYLLE